MSTEENKKEVAEITVLTAEQIEALPKEVKENVTFLTEKLGGSELATLNPIVVELLEIREMNEALVLMPKNSKGDFNKVNIEQYKELKSKQRSFNSKIKSSAKELKIEPAKITKGIIAIEKTFLAENKAVQEDAAEKFQDYEADVIEKARLAKLKKDKALQDKINEEARLKDEANLSLNKTIAYNKIKYELISKQYTEDVSDAVLNANEVKLRNLRNTLSQTDYDKVIEGVDISILEQDVNTELKEYWMTSRSKALESIDARLKAIEQEKENDVLKAKNETIKEVAKEIRQEPQQFTPVPSSHALPNKPTLPPPPMFQTIEACISNIEFNEYTDEDGRELNESRAWIKLKELISKQ